MKVVQNVDVGTIHQVTESIIQLEENVEESSLSAQNFLGRDMMGNHEEVQVVSATKEPFDASCSNVSKASSDNSSISEEEDESESDDEKSKHSIQDTKSKSSQLQPSIMVEQEKNFQGIQNEINHNLERKKDQCSLRSRTALMDDDGFTRGLL